jgi:ABC-type multidrug transport system fused ATPase/permease subunit
MGARLSGGQRQRVAVARALLADFPVLLLDEPAEHLEPAAADALTADLLDVTEGRAALLITHRLSGLHRVDEIVVLDQGAVVERGTHDELLAAGGRYAAMWWEERLGDQLSAGARIETGEQSQSEPDSEPTPSVNEGGETA